MTEKEEAAYLEGEKALARRFLGECLRTLGGDATAKEHWQNERAEAVGRLRALFRDLDLSDDWPDDLHLADIIERLGDVMDREERAGREG